MSLISRRAEVVVGYATENTEHKNRADRVARAATIGQFSAALLASPEPFVDPLFGKIYRPQPFTS